MRVARSYSYIAATQTSAMLGPHPRRSLYAVVMLHVHVHASVDHSCGAILSVKNILCATFQESKSHVHNDALHETENAYAATS
jgi:hypothetical protein